MMWRYRDQHDSQFVASRCGASGFGRWECPLVERQLGTLHPADAFQCQRRTDNREFLVNRIATKKTPGAFQRGIDGENLDVMNQRRIKRTVSCPIVIGLLTCVATGFALGTTNIAQGDDLPACLLIGDSIRSGYQGTVESLLAGQFTFSVPPSGWTGAVDSAWEFVDSWLAAGPYDVIHFNWGLHDVYTQRRRSARLPFPSKTMHTTHGSWSISSKQPVRCSFGPTRRRATTRHPPSMRAISSPTTRWPKRS